MFLECGVASVIIGGVLYWMGSRVGAAVMISLGLVVVAQSAYYGAW